MFEDALKELFEKIFAIEKVTYRMPSFHEQDPQEQGCLFVDVQTAYPFVTDGEFRCKVQGDAMVVAQYQNLPIGFFAKAIAKADASLTKDLFFYNFESNKQRYGDLVQRGFSFVYFFRSQFDPAIGTITEVDITTQES